MRRPAGVPSSAYRVQVVNADGKWTDVLPDGPIVGFVRAVEVFDAVVPTFEKRILKGLGRASWKILSASDVNRLCGRKIVAPKENAVRIKVELQVVNEDGLPDGAHFAVDAQISEADVRELPVDELLQRYGVPFASALLAGLKEQSK